MSDNKLHLIPVLENGQTYDASFGSIVLSKAGYFGVTIKEYQEEEQKIKELEKKKAAAKDFAIDKWEENQKKGWSEKKLKEEYQQDIQEYSRLETQVQNYRETYNNVNWCWQMVGKKTNPNNLSHNDSFSKGIYQIKSTGKQRIKFPEFLIGGGISWIEAFHENTRPTGQIPYGLSVQCYGIPEIARIEWTDMERNPLTEKIGFNSKVILHIYTKALYGQELEIKLTDKNSIISAQNKAFSDVPVFQRQVNIKKLEKRDLGKKGVSGVLTKEGQKDDEEPEYYTQKIEIEILIEEAWDMHNGSVLSIFPSIKSLTTDTYFEKFEGDALNVVSYAKAITSVQQVSNKPAVIGQVETNVAAFHPCQYTGITLEYEKDKKTETVEIYKEDPGVSKKPNIEIGLILGSEPKKFSIKVDEDSNTDECRFHGGTNDHAKNIFSFNKTKLPKNVSITKHEPKNIEGSAYFDYKRSDMMQYFLLPNNFSKVVKYSHININALSCRHQNYYNLTVLPDIEWELAFIITTMAGFRVKTENTTLTRLNQGLGEYQFRGIKAEQTGKLVEKGGVGYSLNIKYSINGGDFYEQISLDFVKNIEKIIGTYNAIAEFAEIFKGNENNVTSAAISTSTVKKMTFDIEPPAIVFLLKWKYDYAKKNNLPVANFTGAAGFKPLIGLKIGVDLVANADKFGLLVGAIINWGAKFVKELTELDLYILVETGVALNYDIGLSYNEIDGFAPNTKQKAVVDLTFTIKAGIKKKEVIFIANVSQMEGNKLPTNETDQETFKVEGAATTGIRYTEEHGIEKGKGNYKKVDVRWLGAEITITIVPMAHKRKMNSPPNGQLKQKFIVLKPKTVYGPEITYTQNN